MYRSRDKLAIATEWTYKSLEQQFTVQFQNEDQAEQRAHRDHPYITSA